MLCLCQELLEPHALLISTVTASLALPGRRRSNGRSIPQTPALVSTYRPDPWNLPRYILLLHGRDIGNLLARRRIEVAYNRTPFDRALGQPVTQEDDQGSHTACAASADR